MKVWTASVLCSAVLLASPVAMAGLSGTISFASDYDYRGIDQTDGHPALQGSLDFSTEFGFYGSAWGSSLDWGDDSDADIEIDYVVGFSREIGDTGLAYDVGVLFYTYPGLSPANFVEYYGGLSYKGFDLKLSYSDDFAGVGESGWYVNGGYTHEWESGVSAFVYGGYSYGNAFDQSKGQPVGFPSYFNYGLGVGYTMNNLYLEIKGVGTDQSGEYKVSEGTFANDYRTIFTVSVTFP